MTGRVLVVDDEADIRALCRISLEVEGLEVDEAADGDEAVRKARDTKPDLMLLDLMLPGRDGWQVLRALKADAATAAIDVVVLTSCGGADERDRSRREGARDYLTKPFDPMALARWALERLQGAQPREPR